MIIILGISAFYHDSAAALIVDGVLVAAAQEERFTRIRHDSSYPVKAIEYTLSEAELSFSDINYVVFYEKPFLKFERLLETYVAKSPKGFLSFCKAMPIWLREKLFQKDFLLKNIQKQDKGFLSNNILFSDHHYSHAASAFYPSPFDEAVVLVLDGVGEWATATVAIGKGKNLNVIKEIHFPHSIGLLYSAFTYYLGFKVNSGEYKVMGLAPYGQPKFKDLILGKLVDIKEDGSFRLDQSYFSYSSGLTMTNSKFSKLFGMPVRKPEQDALTMFHMDIAASIQAVTEEIVLKITKSLATEYRIPNLCLAGGVALNCVANGKLLESGVFKDIWIQPAAGDAGGAVGAALTAWYKELGNERIGFQADDMNGAYLGPCYSQAEIEERVSNLGGVFSVYSEDEMLNETVQALVDGKAIGWFQGRMEFGPRSLGCRSIIADPRSSEMQRVLNLKVKQRESFRPFAPSVLAEDTQDYFELEHDSPYMLFVAKVKKDKCFGLSLLDEKKEGIDKLNVKRSEIPAVTHVDYTARVQTVHSETNPLYYALIKRFKSITGCPVIINTSFNVRGEPIVCTPEDAFRCFMGTELDVLVIGNLVLYKKDQKSTIIENYRDQYELD